MIPDEKKGGCYDHRNRRPLTNGEACIEDVFSYKVEGESSYAQEEDRHPEQEAFLVLELGETKEDSCDCESLYCRIDLIGMPAPLCIGELDTPGQICYGTVDLPIDEIRDPSDGECYHDWDDQVIRCLVKIKLVFFTHPDSRCDDTDESSVKGHASFPEKENLDRI